LLEVGNPSLAGQDTGGVARLQYNDRLGASAPEGDAQVNFEGASAIVTGGSSGIGKATAKTLASRGANVFLIARESHRLEAAVKEVEAERRSPHQQVAALPADVRDYEAVEGAVAAAVDRGGAPDILVTCAGIARPGYFEDLPLSVFRDAMDTNYFGTLHAIKAVVPHMIEQRAGHIVTVSSVAGFMGVFGYSAYGPSKYAVLGLSETLRSELKPHGISVSVLIPPDTDTPQLREEDKYKPAETRLISGTISPASPEKVAQALVEGIEQGRHLIIPGLESKVIYRLKGLSCSLVNWYTDRMVAKAQTGM
jgi:3-dehydrosphinganine reductase